LRRARSTGGEVELTAIHKFDETHERTLRSDVKYRFVIDMASLQ
jgi:D-arabinose 1-dehydrogenase-like Zn-dependent alcohol dehydrogenase